MSAGHTAERVLNALRAQIMHRVFRPGDRLHPAAIAASLASSVTPVRDALHRLTGEGLVETRTADGFYLPSLDEPGLKDLYDWSAELLLLAIRQWRQSSSFPSRAAIAEEARLADHTAALFLAIARHSRNAEHAMAVARLNARLHAMRIVEAEVIDANIAELDALWVAAAEDRNSLRRLCAGYHRRRRHAAADIVRAHYRLV